MSQTTFGKGHHLHLIDGSGFIFRAYHALPPLTRKSDGLPVGAISGFCNMLFKMVEDQKGSDAPTHLAVVFDHKGKTFRSDIYPEYKAHRPPAPEDLAPQFPITRDATRAFNLACIEAEGFEADDIIATLADQARTAGARVTIVSSDKDLMQMVGGGVEMYDAMKNRRIGVEQVEEKFGVGPDRVIDVQSLAGDSVDNIPGAPGIGIKTAALLINEYGDLDTLLERAGEIKQPKRRETLIEKADQIRISRELVTLKLDTPIDLSFDDMAVNAPDPDVLLPFLAEMEFRTMSARIAAKLGVDAPAIAEPVSDTGPSGTATPAAQLPIDPEKYETVRDVDRLNAWVQKIYDRGYVAVDTETTGLNEMIVDLVGICLSVEPGEACYIPLIHKEGEGDLFGGSNLAPNQIPLDQALDILRPVLQDESILKIGQNMKYDAKIFKRNGIDIAPIDDTMLLSYALHGGLHNHGMDALAERYLDHKPISIKSILGTGKSAITFDLVPIDEATKYAAEDADITLRLWQMFKPQLHAAKVTKVYETLERPLIPVLAKMEMNGIKVDRDHLSRMSNSFAQSMAGLESEIHELAGRSFNVGSPKQLGEILFDELGLEGGKKGKTGAYSTGVDILEDLAAEGHDLPARVLDWRQMSKLKSTYTDALQTHINPDTGRVHTSYVISGASTGRLASTDPNLQNIPIRSEAGRKIREAFVAEEGNVLLALDYSQIELRILAHIAKIDNLKQAFLDGHDIHAMTASEMFHVPIEGMDPMIRRQAKAINFGVIYGISGFGLARNLRIPRKEAQAFIDTYFERFPGIRKYMDDTVAFAKEHGHVETLFGRKIHTAEINAKGPHAGFAKRAAINAPIQGTAADVIRRAMIQMPDAIKNFPAKMLLQVHDELLFEVPKDAVEETTETVRKVMENAASPVVKLDVPLTVDAGVGNNWAEAH
ncbi:DNA polymerase I [Amylibacter kogurei]|uniref:DNA polymerase I n=1 Tax=Paramylibacter kogurei TaxID=1889778 RepID=A0A2G5KAK5_9RHOB|nr:DNA polymerase I [Amylibacter kogurei]PIB26082.1 DNA polymerase I [Amylibacter kogurei]